MITVTDRTVRVDEELFVVANGPGAHGDIRNGGRSAMIGGHALGPENPPVVGRVHGLIPPYSRVVGTVELRPDQVWSIGRRDERFLAADPGRAAWHLGVPDARPDLSVNELELRVGSVAVAVGSGRGAGVTVDGTVRPSPVVLTHGTSYVGPSVSGLHLDFTVEVRESDRFADRAGALAASGTTLRLTLELEAGSTLWRVAHALAWPLLPSQRRPHTLGWSGRDVVERQTQLGWQGSGSGARAVTVLGQQLLTLADKVANCRLSDGRRADVVFPAWPPWVESTADGETRDQRAERRNRYVAEALWRARAVDPSVIDGGRTG